MQLSLPIQRVPEKDRNFHKGGRSFYFFDFDDNIAVLGTPTYIFHKHTGQELELSSGEFAKESGRIGLSGIYKDFKIKMDDENGSFRNFRDRDHNLIEKILGAKQAFVEDLLEALGGGNINWQGPSWHCFYHAVFNQRPMAVITARGHHPETLKKGIKKFVRAGHLPHEPNYLDLYPVSHPEVRKNLGFCEKASVAILKQGAIRSAVKKAFEQYGYNPHHRFGMSDDDPHNIALIVEEMTRLKKEYPETSFSVIETHDGKFFKREVFKDHTIEREITVAQQMNLFQGESPLV